MDEISYVFSFLCIQLGLFCRADSRYRTHDCLCMTLYITINYINYDGYGRILCLSKMIVIYIAFIYFICTACMR